MRAMDLLERLGKKVVFSVQDAERMSGCGQSCAKQALRRLVENGKVRRIERNAYTTSDDIFAIASGITYPSYVSFWSASYFMGYTEQIINTVQMASAMRRKPIKFEKYIIKFIPMKHIFGYKKIISGNGEVLVAENEKLLIDAFLRPEECGNLGEIEKMFRAAEISEEKLVGYLRRVGSQGAIKRVGFLLEKTRGLDISGAFSLDRNYVVLDAVSGKWKETSAKWRVRA